MDDLIFSIYLYKQLILIKKTEKTKTTDKFFAWRKKKGYVLIISQVFRQEANL